MPKLTSEPGDHASAPPRWLAHAALVVVSLGGWIVVGWGSPSGFPLDDAWIHQVVARNFAATGMPGFVSGVPSGGTTSLLWTILLAPAHVAGVTSPVFYTRLAGLLCWVTLVQGLHAITLGDGWPPRVAWLVAAAAACTGNAVWFAWCGMEAVLAAALTVGAVFFWQRARIPALSACLGLLVLTRPEGLVVAALLAVSCTGWRLRARAFVGPIAAAVVLMLVNAWASGHPWPATLAGRRWLYGLDRGPEWRDGIDFAVQWTVQLSRYTMLASPLVGVFVTAGAVAGAWAVRAARPRGWSMLLLSTLATLAVYTAILPRIGHGGRYQPLVVILVAPLSVLGWWRLAGEPQAGRRLVVPALVLLPAAVSLFLWQGILGAGVGHVNATERAIGRYVREQLPGNEPIAAFDIGGLAWELPGRVVDLSGLADGDLRYLRERRLLDQARDRGARWMVLPWSPAQPMAARKALGLDTASLEPIHAEVGDERAWARAFGPTAHAWQGQMIYRVP